MLAGYGYVRLITRWTTPRSQSLIHICLLGASLCILPIGPGDRWRPVEALHPSALIFLMLTATVGLPFTILSATSPLLQTWMARLEYKTPYRMFAISNLASLAALLAYPTCIEPVLGTRAQSAVWSVLYVFFGLLCVAAALRSRGAQAPGPTGKTQPSSGRQEKPFWWFAFAACGSILLLSVTNHINQNIAAVPLLWVLPLAVYLLSFVLTFGQRSFYKHAIWMRLLAFALGILGYAIYNINSLIALPVSVPIFLGGLFICCVFCHGELNRLRPSADQLSLFYLVVAAGGAAGAIAVGLIAPVVFSGVYELPVALLATALLALASSWSERNRDGGAWAPVGLWVAVTACMAAVIVTNVSAYHKDSLSLLRSFYGSLRVVQTPRAGPSQQRILYHGTIEHGAQFLEQPMRLHPTTYYGPDSGAGILLRECFEGAKRVGVIGLGVGTVAAYGKPGDQFQFFDINAQVIDIAQSLFSYLRESKAQIRIVTGDGRLSLAKDSGKPFDALLIDAFSGDAIPVHLLTREAVALFREHLTANGTIAFHISNDFLDLAPLVQNLAREAGYKSILVHSHADPDEGTLPADWMLVTNNDQVLANSSIRLHAAAVKQRSLLRTWTDDYSNLLEVFKLPDIRH